MRKIFFILVSCLIFFSCEKENFDKVKATYYGRTEVGYTFETRLTFYTKEQQEVNITLWSKKQELEEGDYIICPDIITAPFDYKGVYVDKTFARNCTFNGSLITDGTITIEKDGKQYTIILDVTDIRGNSIVGLYEREVLVEDKSHTSRYGGLFVDCSFNISGVSSNRKTLFLETALPSASNA